MITRRRLLQTGAGMLLAPALQPAKAQRRELLTWHEFTGQVQELAGAHAAGQAAVDEVIHRGVDLLQRLDTGSPGLASALDSSWESGNRFWLWQRIYRQPDLLGGVLTVERNNAVPLHDHPGATGMLRILSGELELWQYDIDPTEKTGPDATLVRLRRVAHRILRPGDTAALSPDSGNIHTLRSISSECRMLDCFIPPYERTRRSWYTPVHRDRPDGINISCRRNSEYDFDPG